MKARAWKTWSVALALSCAACGAGGSPRDSEGGSFGLGLQVASGATLTRAPYTIEGPEGFLSAGFVSVGSSPDVPIDVGPLPVGTGYVVSIDATASDDLTVCSGSTSFDVVDGSAVLTVVVHLECSVPSGDIVVQGTLNVCPTVDGLDAAPLDVRLGGISRLLLAAHDTDAGPAALGYGWSVNGIKLSRQTTPSLAFTCTSAGEAIIIGTVSDGDPNPACADSASVKVTCQ